MASGGGGDRSGRGKTIRQCVCMYSNEECVSVTDVSPGMYVNLRDRMYCSQAELR